MRAVRLTACILFGTLLGASEASASGFEFPSNGTAALSRGGAFTARADDLSAMELNPAGLLSLEGTYIYLGNNVSVFDMTHTRLAPVYQEYPDDQGGEPSVDYTDLIGYQKGASVKNGADPQWLGPLAGVSTDFGLRDWRFALGLFGPSANAVTDYPVDGPQRYTLTSTDVKLVFYTASVAYQPLDNLRFGVSLHWYDLMQAKMALVVCGGWNDLHLAGPSYDVLAQVNVADRFGLAATVGAWWQPLSFLEVGLSFKGPPVGFEAEGDTQLTFLGDLMQDLYQKGIDTNGTDGLVSFRRNGTATTKIPTKMTFDYPMVGRLGVRYVQREGDSPKSKELFDVEADVVWEGWSVLDRYQFDMDGYFRLVGAGVGEAEDLNLLPVKVERHYKDTWSFRLGGQYQLLDWMAVRAGGYYETGSVPQEYTNLDFAGFDRVGVAVGLGFDFRPWTVSLGYSHIFQAERDVSLEESAVNKSFPLQTTQPVGDQYKVGAGSFDASYDIFSASVSLSL